MKKKKRQHKQFRSNMFVILFPLFIALFYLESFNESTRMELFHANWAYDKFDK